MKLPTAGDEVPKPAGFELVAWYDLSPMRPDEYANTIAWRWQEAVALRMAFQQGIEDARREARHVEILMSDGLPQAG